MRSFYRFLLLILIGIIIPLSVHGQNKKDTTHPKLLKAFERARFVYKKDPQLALSIVDSIKGQIDYNKDIELILSCCNLEGMIYNLLDLSQEALESFDKVIRISKEKNHPTFYIRGLNNLANVYHKGGRIEDADSLFRKALIFAKKRSVSDYNGVLCFNIADVNIDLEKYDSVLHYLNTAQPLEVMEIFELSRADKINNPELQNNYAYVLSSAAKLFDRLDSLEQSYAYYYESYKLRKALGIESEEVKSLNSLTAICLKFNKLTEAIRYSKEAKIICENKGFKYQLKRSLSNIIDYYHRMDKSDSLAFYRGELIKLNEEIGQENLNEKLVLLNTRSKIQNQELIHKLEIAEKEFNNKLIIWVGAVLSILFIVSLGLMYRNYRIKSSSNRIISEKNHELEMINSRITESIQYASKIQNSFLPEQTTLSKYFQEVFIFYKPRDIVSGDFYWLGEVDNDIILAVADCTGHGVPGSMVSMTGNSLLNDIVGQRQIVEPAQILGELNKGILKTFQKESGVKITDGMDISVIRFNTHESRLSFSGAMNPLYIIDKKELRIVEADRQSIGGGGLSRRDTNLFDKTFQQHEISLSEDSVCYMFTDGYMDQFGGPSGKKFNSKRFNQLLRDISEHEFSRQYTILESTLSKWMQASSKTQIDDITVLGFKLKA